MVGFQDEKRIVLDYYKELDTAPVSRITQVLQNHTTPEYTWRGFHPFHLQTDVNEVSQLFWTPFRNSITHMQRRMDVFFAGKNFIDDRNSVWVCSMGHLMGLFDAPWLGIQPTKKMIMLRYAEFHKIENGKIAETAFYFDIPHLMMQAGYAPFPEQKATHMVQPGPAPHDALLFKDAKPNQAQSTMDAMNFMINDLGQWKSGLPLVDELARSWHDDMIWWGPAGIGATYTIARYAEQHSGPFRAAFSDRSGTGHIARIAEGHYGGFFGWPNFSAKPTGGYLGLPPSDVSSEFRVIDIYRREDNKLKENWIFIDLLHFFNQQGVDLLGEIQKGTK
ncbi:MAG: ester cyclase [Amylibacter sp.]|jgi:predicted ester cyclase|tara:strand:+ start:2493 stop:3494 length:1002 start_codon:yes stop_codon:yes gene_type:complete